MGSINMGRVIIGGLAAGVVINLCEFVLNGVVLAQDWAEWARANNKPEMGTNAMVGFTIWGFLMGIAAVWVYAAIRPRFGAGPGTALKAGLCVWILAYFLASAGVYFTSIFPEKFIYIGLTVGLVEVLVGTLVGAWLYREHDAESLRMSQAGASA